MFFKLKEGSRSRGHKAALVKEQCRSDMRKYSFSQREIPENGADVAHLSAVHGACFMSGIDLSRVYDNCWSFSEHIWNAQWTPNTEADERHIASIQLTHVLEAFGYQVSLFNMKVFARQIGPGIVYLTFETPFGRGAFLQALTPVGPLMQRMIHHIYMERWIPTIIAKFYLLGEALMFERDIMIWNNKRYASKPVLVKSKEDALVQQYRRWYSQFYSEHSPRFTFHKDTLDW
ncbi:Cholesterol 7-desaturase [Lamellibrachia satsuma]|nr:Cholesterol 7-desaturase [Lamellibrachia satsuma]